MIQVSLLKGIWGKLFCIMLALFLGCNNTVTAGADFVKTDVSDDKQSGEETDEVTYMAVPTKPGRVKLLSCKSKQKKSATVKWKKVIDSDGYQVQWSEERNFSDYGQLFLSDKSVVIKGWGLQSKKKFYFRVRAYKSGNNANDYQDVYGRWSKIKKVKIK